MSFKEYIFKQNTWWTNVDNLKDDQHLFALKKEKFIWRNNNFLNYDFKPGVYIATGMRQVGKTTHLKMFIENNINLSNKENFFYFNCDILSNKKEVVELIEYYLSNIANKKKKVYIILDEITAVKDGILAIKYLIDSGYKENIVYILSGSSSVNFKKTGEFLPGRRGSGVDFIFHPLSFLDYVKLKYPKEENILKNIAKEKNLELAYQKVKVKINLKKEFDKYLISGGIPKIINVFERQKEISIEEFQSYLSWIKSEVAKNGKDEYYIKTILERIYQSLSSDLSYNSISQDSGIGSHNTIYSYLNFLEDSFIVKQVYNYDFSQKKIQRRKNKKVYFNDPFVYWLINFWIKLGGRQDFADLKNDVLKSRIVENVVMIFLQKKFGEQLYFYKNNFEIDFINDDFAIEVKYQNKISNAEISNMLKFSGQKFIISKNTFKIYNNINIMPIEFFLLVF